MKDCITDAELSAFRSAFLSDQTNRLAMNTVCANGLQASALQLEPARRACHEYAVTLPQHNITWQKKSGRCWMFSGFNFLRDRVIKRLQLDDFSFSGSYLMFWDKFEKANFFLEEIIEKPDEPLDSELMMELLRGVRGDGGEWCNFTALVKKYGIVPSWIQPETVSTDYSRDMVPVIIEKLREFARDLRLRQKSGADPRTLRCMKDGMLETVYRLYCICYGTPVRTFDVKIRNKHGEFICFYGMTPKAFYDELVGVDLDSYVVLFAGASDGAAIKKVKTQDSGYIMEAGDGIPYHITVSHETLKKLTAAQLQAGEPVYFGCDVGQSCWRTGGILDENIFDYPALFQVDFHMTREQRFLYRLARSSHAMTFKGVDFDRDGKPLYWRVENSWGPEAGKDGMFTMADPWFDQYCYEVVIHRSHVPDAILAIWDGEETDTLPRMAVPM